MLEKIGTFGPRGIKFALNLNQSLWTKVKRNYENNSRWTHHYGTNPSVAMEPVTVALK